MKKNQKGFGQPVIFIALIVVIAVAGIGWYVYHTKHTKKYSPTTSAKSVSAPASTTSSTVAPISDSLKENISASIESKNTAALEGYMASSVNVVIAGSEKTGYEPAATAVSDIDYVSGGTSPWDFNLSSSILTAYKNGSYGSYFGDRTYIGKSANNYVIAFHINNSGKIDVVFMTNNGELLL